MADKEKVEEPENPKKFKNFADDVKDCLSGFESNHFLSFFFPFAIDILLFFLFFPNEKAFFHFG
jgi:hypothetical protein